MGIFRNPPQPFVGGRQPLEPGKLAPSLSAVPANNPPIGKLVATVALVTAMWQPVVPYFQVQQKVVQPGIPAPVFVPKSSVPRAIYNSWIPQVGLFVGSGPFVPEEVDLPSVNTSNSIWGIYSSWVKTDPLPQLQRKLVQPGVAPANPPASRQASFWATYAAWAPVAPPIVRGPKLVLGASVDNPPIPVPENFWAAYAGWAPGPFYQPPLPRLVQGTALVVNDPIPRSTVNTYIVLGAWIPGPPMPILPPKLVQGTPLTVNTPPGYEPEQFWSIYASWIKNDPLPTLQRFAPITATAPAPVLLAPTSFWAIYGSWLQAPPLPQKTGNFIPGSSVDNPPILNRLSIQWLVDAPGIIKQRFVPIVAASGADVVIYQRFWLNGVIRSWFGPDPLIGPQRKINPSLANVPTDFPPPYVNQIFTIWESWKFPDPIIRRYPKLVVSGSVLKPQAGLVAVFRPVYTIQLKVDCMSCMPELLSPVIVIIQKATITFDFGLWPLPDGVGFSGAPIVALTVHSGTDPDPQSRITSPPQIVTAGEDIGGTGIANRAIAFQIGNIPGPVTYCAVASCALSDGDTDNPTGWALIPAVQPS